MSFWTKIDKTEEFLDAARVTDPSKPFTIILKHSTRCAISSMAKNRLERSPDPRINYFIVDIISNRSLSNFIAEETGVRHESPQSFLYAGGQLIDVKSHMAIDPVEVVRRLGMIIQN
jgi:bacillithiol system protein YtxJ